MSTTINSRYIIDLPEWRALSNPVYGSFTTVNATGTALAPDYRGRDYASPLVFFNNSNVLAYYNIKQDAWMQGPSPSIGGTFGGGSTAVFCPTFSPMGTIAAGGTVNKVTLSTSLGLAVNANQLTNRGDGLGYIVRIIGNAAGSSGKIEERRIIANTSGATPTIYFDQPLSFVPVAGDRYEFLSGSVLFLNTGTTVTANIFRRYDVLTQNITSLSTTGTIGTVQSNYNQLIPLDEQHVPYNRNPGEGYLVGAATYDTSGSFTKGCLTATATAANTLTGQAASGDAAVVANQYRNYQIRVVEDTAIPTAVGQRRRITSHTAGASPVYTLATNWTVTPSATCKFVIENDTDRVIAFFGGSTTIYNYFISNLGNTAATANTWDTTSWAARSVAFGGGGITWHAFGINTPSTVENVVKSSTIVSWRGGSINYDVFDISGAATGSWTNGLQMIFSSNTGAETFPGSSENFHFAYNAHTQEGKYMYTALGGGTSLTNAQRSYVKFNSLTGFLEKVAGPKVANGSNTTANATASFCSVFQDGSTKVAFYNTPRLLGAGIDYYQLMLTF